MYSIYSDILPGYCADFELSFFARITDRYSPNKRRQIDMSSGLVATSYPKQVYSDGYTMKKRTL